MNKEISKSYGSPRWTGEIADCSLPVTLDTYSNCSFGCIYCFSQYQRGVGAGAEDYFAKKVKAISPDKVFRIISGEDKNSQFYKYVSERRTIQYGGLSDQFDGYEKRYGITYELLKKLREINYPICFSTKSAWVFFDEKYRNLFKGADNWNMKFSIITLDPVLASKIEVGVPTPQDRLKAMHEYTTLSKGGATLRLRPFILGVSDKTYLDLIKEAYDAGATAVTTEFFCLENRSVESAKEHYRTLSECCGFDIVEFYKKYSNGSGYLRLNRKIKEKYIRNMQELCDKLGIRFYVSDSHFKECSNNCCCCGLSKDWNYSNGNFSYALQIAKQNGEVHFYDIEKEMSFLEVELRKSALMQSSQLRAKYAGMTVKEYLRYLWNNPKMGQSPYKIFEKVLVPNGIDSMGDIVYKYDPSVTFVGYGNDLKMEQPCTD